MANFEERKNVDVARKSSISDLFRSMKNVILLERVFGIYRFIIQGDEVIFSSWINKMHGLCMMALNIIVIICFMDVIDIVIGKSLLVDLLYQIPGAIILIQYLLTLIFTTMIVNKTNKELFVTLADLDRRLVMSEKFYQKIATETNKYLILMLICHLIISSLDLATDDGIDPREFMYLPLYLLQKTEIFMFCFMVEMLRSRLVVINEYINTFLKEKDEDIISVVTSTENEGIKIKNMIGRPSENNMKIRDLAIMYDSIGSICSMVNSIFNFQIFMTLVSAFCYIVITIWTSLYYYRTPENNSGALLTIIIWCVTTLLTVAAMCFICERLRSMRNNTKILVNQIIMDYDLPKIMRVQAKAFMEVIDAWPLCIMVYDMFTVDTSLILKFISVSTTYLIVIVQISHFGEIGS